MVAKYWSRLWIVPEVFKAKRIKIVCQKSLISWSRFMAFVDTLQDENHPVYVFDKSLRRKIADSKLFTFLKAWRRHRKEDCSFKYLLRAYGKNECSDLRDKVFVLGVLSTKSEQFEIDYNMTTAELFERFLLHTEITEADKLEVASSLVETLELKVSDYFRGYLKVLSDSIVSDAREIQAWLSVLSEHRSIIHPDLLEFNREVTWIDSLLPLTATSAKICRQYEADGLAHCCSSEGSRTVKEYWQEQGILAYRMPDLSGETILKSLVHCNDGPKGSCTSFVKNLLRMVKLELRLRYGVIPCGLRKRSLDSESRRSHAIMTRRRPSQIISDFHLNALLAIELPRCLVSDFKFKAFHGFKDAHAWLHYLIATTVQATTNHAARHRLF